MMLQNQNEVEDVGCSSPEADRSKMLRIMQTYTWVQVYSFWGLINDSIAAHKQTCSCSGRPSVTFRASGFTWFATMCWCVKCIVWMGLLLAPCKFQHPDRSCLLRKTGKHRLSELFQAYIILDNGCLQGWAMMKAEHIWSEDSIGKRHIG